MPRVSRVCAVVFLVAALASQSAVFAAVVKTPLDGYGVVCVRDPGDRWTSGKDGKILHVRGQINDEWLYDPVDFELIGEITAVANYDLNLVTGSGGINGAASILLYDFSTEDSFIGTFAGHFKSFQFFLRVVAKGTGELEGARRRARLQSVGLPAELIPKLPCPPEEIGGVWFATGTVDDSR